MFRQIPNGPTFTQAPLPCPPEDEPEPDWAGVVAGAVLAGAGAGAEAAGVPGWDATWLGFEPPDRGVPPLVLPDPGLVCPLPPLPPPPAARTGGRPDEPRPGWVSGRGSDPPPRPPGPACAP